MPYAQRRMLDADAHLMEPPGWLERYVTADVAARLAPLHLGDPAYEALIASSDVAYADRQANTEVATVARRELLTMARRGWPAFGASDPIERGAALDQLGFDLQVIYPTAAFPQVVTSPRDVQEAAAIGMNRGIAEFCAADVRLMPTAYVPLHLGIEAAMRVLADARARSTPVVMVDMVPAKGAQAITHPDHDSLWAAIVDAGMVLSVHVGLDNGWRPVRPEFFDNGRSLEHFRSDAPGDALSYMTIGYPGELFLSAMVFDGVLARFPGLRILVAELAAAWVPGFLQQLDQAGRAFRRLQDLSHLTARPSDYIRRQVRFTPFAGEPVGWMIEASNSSLYIFSSDYPHHEGTDDPVRRFEQTMPAVDEATLDQFFWQNLADLLDERMPSALRALRG